MGIPNGQQVRLTPNNRCIDATGVVLTETISPGAIVGIDPGWEVTPLGFGTACQSQPIGTVCVMSLGTVAPS